MAGLGQPGLARLTSPPPPPRALPAGPCNHRDVTGSCGCRQFWDKCSAEIHQHSKERKSGSERSTYCVCGHHACFHEYSNAQSQPPAPSQVQARPPDRCDGRCRLYGMGCDHHKSPHPRRHQVLATGTQSPARFLTPTNNNGEQRLTSNAASQANTFGLDEQARGESTLSSTTGLPRIPSMCLLSNDRYSATNTIIRNETDQSRGSLAGLGLSMLNVDATQNPNNGPPSVVSTVPTEVDPYAPQFQGAHGALQAILEQDPLLHLNVEGDTIPDTYNPDDFIQSATNIATPSVTHTPDLGIADNAVEEGRKFIEGLVQLTSSVEQRDVAGVQPTKGASGLTQNLLLPSSLHATEDQLRTTLESASPQAIPKLLSYLKPLHNLLTSMPHVAKSMREHDDRIAMLEQNNSFNYVQPDDLNQQFDTFDGRLLHLENRMDDHEALHTAIDADQSSNSRGRISAVNESFTSAHSIQSSTSSALIIAAMDRKEIATELGGVKERLDQLEATAPPTSLNPWEVEIVLLPWGRDLRGIWFSPEEPMHDTSKTTTQESEEWTQARSLTLGHSRTSLVPFRDTDSSPHPGVKGASRSSHPFSDTESGWSSQEIGEWVSGSPDELLSPKACGSNNLVYKRLKSRGFVVGVKLTSANANDIQKTISHAFKNLLGRFKYNDDDENPMISSYPGLRASFIPLKKIIKDSRLRFLTPSEMASSALWTAQFLASGVLMRVSGGKKRLYVTQRESYIQPMDQTGDIWTWHEMRLLPRWQPDADSPMQDKEENGQAQVPEADAREPCWSFVDALDAPPASVNSSFASMHSVQLSMRPAERDWRRSMTPSSILKNRQPPQPISPQSEFHSRPPIHYRTLSASTADPAVLSSSKRRLNSSPVKHTSAPQSQTRAPSQAISRLKRRRVGNSSSPQPQSDTREAQPTIWANTPRRSREPPSPFYSSEPHIRLPRTSSDFSRPSQRSAAPGSRLTPSAYATPHSGAFINALEFGGAGKGDTEADDDIYQVDDDDGEQSWRGVTTGEDDSDSAGDTEAGAEFQMNSLSDVEGESIFDSDGQDDNDSVNDDADEGVFGAQNPHQLERGAAEEQDDDEDDDEDEDADDVYDTLLGVLRS
ncbi:unnamed protein product [Periconia digitata]|uniref:Uncharacterized protein n=1 Tax=Periconia digitata TaxID=1303443 RepID=A0A9W4UHR8_9PLEO|nr:unnamed protein product [Periconia digitata]